MKRIKHVVVFACFLATGLVKAQTVTIDQPSVTPGATTTIEMPAVTTTLTGTEQPTVSVSTETTAAPAVEPAAAAPTETPAAAPTETTATTSTETQSVSPAEPVASPTSTETPAATPVTTETAPVETPSVASTPPETVSELPLTGPYAKALSKANKLYSEKAFADAIPYYEKVMGYDSNNKGVLSKLGDCYRYTNNVSGQLLCYGGLVNLGVAEPIQQLYYGEALVESGDAEKAKPYFEKYSLDTRGKEHASSFEKRKQYTKNSDAYSLSAASFNSTESDFCAVKFYDVVVFASTRKKTDWIKREQSWTNGNFLKLYAVEGFSREEKPKFFMGDMNSKYNDGPICFSKDYNTIYFTRNTNRKEEIAKDGTFKLKIFEATLDENGFSMVKPLPFNNNDYHVAHPSVSPDGFTMYFSSDMEGGKGGMDIYMCKKDSSGVWGTPVNMGDVINTAGNEVFPYISNAGVLYFSSNGHDGLGGLDIFEVKMKDGQVKKIYNMGEPVNSKDDDFGMYLFDDNVTGYISSNRKNGGLDDDIYNLQILRDVKRGKEATLVLKDKSSGELLDSTKIVINGDTVMTNDKGEYLAAIDEDASYKVEAFRADYFSVTDSVSYNSSEEDAFTREIVMEKDPKLFLRGIITDAKTKELLEGVSIKLTDIAANTEVDSYVTTATGDYYKALAGKKIGDKLTYLIRIEKDGYLQRTVILSHTIDKPGEINMNQLLNLSLGKVEVGMDLAKMIDIKPIYFDLGKSTIRKDAAAELDKIVQVMNEYPNMFIELGSHTDCRSSAASNLKLSTARAKASADYIIKKGINKMRIVGKGYGESKLLNNCACEGKTKSDCPEEEHEKNRRTEFLITRLK